MANRWIVPLSEGIRNEAIGSFAGRFPWKAIDGTPGRPF
jgi:hypothetical protein